ncbi:MAG: sulfite reductase subunit A [Nitrospinae bacterium RIFCSPLOWO2_12_39_16]|nr:MAG: sulfite reductase subunit A [Nitrospinae bacterium RIFCSPLOWO2_12_39_16]
MKSHLKIESKQLNILFDSLKDLGYTIVAPTIREGSIVYDNIDSASELPVGWTDEQSAATYRLKRRGDNSYFGYNLSPYAWKRFLFPPRVKIFSAVRKGKSFKVNSDSKDASVPNYAFIGVRPCELQAIKIQDKVFNNGQYIDTVYKNRKEKVFIAAVNCTQAGGTCFCVSMNSGPKADNGFDIALTEIIDKGEHYFIVEAGSEKGNELMSKIPHTVAGQSEIENANKLVQTTAKQMNKSMDTKDIKELLYANLESRHWDDVATRCLTCANCTMVCPTCFCTTVEDVTDLTGDNAERWKRWDSCFTMDFAKVFGGNFRSSSRARYRQWMTHKLASWIDQFGTSGCVGCGRCITWCPVGIDITEEVKKIKGETK